MRPCELIQNSATFFLLDLKDWIILFTVSKLLAGWQFCTFMPMTPFVRRKIILSGLLKYCTVSFSSINVISMGNVFSKGFRMVGVRLPKSNWTVFG
jgi:hypothetical protein